MINSLSFKADPPQPFHTYDYHLNKAVKKGYFDDQLNHRAHSGIVSLALDGLMEILTVPEDYCIVLLKENKILYETLAYLESGEKSEKYPAAGVKNKDPLIIKDIDLMTGQKNNTMNLKEGPDFNTSSFLHLDISLSSPTDPLDYEKFQSFSFDTRYGFGMGQDLVIWIVKEDLLCDFTNKFSGKYLEFSNGSKNIKKCFVQRDSAIPSIYIFGMILRDFLHRGINIIRNEIKYKSIILYNSLRDNPNLDPLIKDPGLQSQNVLCANTEIPGEEISGFMSENRIEFDLLSGTGKESLIRIANYPVHSKEQMEFLVDLIGKL